MSILKRIDRTIMNIIGNTARIIVGVPLPQKYVSPPRVEKKYPYIVDYYGVGVNEIGNMDRAIIKTGRTSWTDMSTDDAIIYCQENEYYE